MNELDEVFENGRQDVIDELGRTLLKRLKFNDECLASKNKYEYTTEQMKSFSQIYNEVLNDLFRLKTKRANSERWGGLK